MNFYLLPTNTTTYKQYQKLREKHTKEYQSRFRYVKEVLKADGLIHQQYDLIHGCYFKAEPDLTKWAKVDCIKGNDVYLPTEKGKVTRLLKPFNYNLAGILKTLFNITDMFVKILDIKGKGIYIGTSCDCMNADLKTVTFEEFEGELKIMDKEYRIKKLEREIEELVDQIAINEMADDFYYSRGTGKEDEKRLDSLRKELKELKGTD